jgi:hypothetical protein
MILRELFYFNADTLEREEDNRYEPRYDSSPLTRSDTRKTRLTLKQINRIRQSSELHRQEVTKDLEFVKQMYGLAATGDADTI